jgi:hypothetical protein
LNEEEPVDEQTNLEQFLDQSLRLGRPPLPRQNQMSTKEMQSIWTCRLERYLEDSDSSSSVSEDYENEEYSTDPERMKEGLIKINKEIEHESRRRKNHEERRLRNEEPGGELIGYCSMDSDWDQEAPDQTQPLQFQVEEDIVHLNNELFDPDWNNDSLNNEFVEQ